MCDHIKRHPMYEEFSSIDDLNVYVISSEFVKT